MPINISIKVSIRRKIENKDAPIVFIQPDMKWICACLDGIEDCTTCDGMGMVNYNLRNMAVK